MSEAEIIINNIREIIDEKGYLKNKVAARSGFSEKQFSAILNGKKTLKASYIPAIAKALGVEPNALFRNA